MKKTIKIVMAAVLAAALGIFLWSALCAEAEPNVRIIRETEQSVGPAPSDHFTGDASLRGYFPAGEIGVSTGAGAKSRRRCARATLCGFPRESSTGTEPRPTPR